MKPFFDQLVIDDQEYLKKDENLEKVFQVMKSICTFTNNTAKMGQLEKALESVLQIEGSLARWCAIRDLFKGKQDKRIWSMIERELTLGLLYPKIDAHVSAQTNHLLKCPFNVHHDTGKLSLPILDIETFDVAKCPTIFDALENKEMLEPYLKAFDAFCEPLLTSG